MEDNRRIAFFVHVLKTHTKDLNLLPVHTFTTIQQIDHPKLNKYLALYMEKVVANPLSALLTMNKAVIANKSFVVDLAEMYARTGNKEKAFEIAKDHILRRKTEVRLLTLMAEIDEVPAESLKLLTTARCLYNLRHMKDMALIRRITNNITYYERIMEESARQAAGTNDKSTTTSGRAGNPNRADSPIK